VAQKAGSEAAAHWKGADGGKELGEIRALAVAAGCKNDLPGEREKKIIAKVEGRTKGRKNHWALEGPISSARSARGQKVMGDGRSTRF